MQCHDLSVQRTLRMLHQPSNQCQAGQPYSRWPPHPCQSGDLEIAEAAIPDTYVGAAAMAIMACNVARRFTLIPGVCMQAPGKEVEVPGKRCNPVTGMRNFDHILLHLHMH